MKKIVDYILSGKGIGFKWLLCFSVIVSIFFGLIIKNVGNSLVPSIQEVADQILPVKVEDGHIVTPDGIDKQLKLQVSENLPEFQIPFSIRTDVDALEEKDLQPGIYLTRTALYNVVNGEMEVKEIRGSFEIPKGDYSDLLKTTMTYVALISVAFSVLVCFVSFTILALFCSVTAHILLKIFKKQADFSFRMRLSTCAIILMYFLKYLAELSGTSVGLSFVLVLIILFQALFIYRGVDKIKSSQK